MALMASASNMPTRWSTAHLLRGGQNTWSQLRKSHTNRPLEGRRRLPSAQLRFAAKENFMAVDTILYNAKIATNRVPAFVEAVAITGGTISAIGTDEEILRLRGPKTTVIDGKRRTVLP